MCILSLVHCVGRVDRSALGLDKVDQGVGGGIVGRHLPGALHLGLDGLGQLLAQLDAPLVVGVDVPDDALKVSDRLMT